MHEETKEKRQLAENHEERITEEVKRYEVLVGKRRRRKKCSIKKSVSGKGS